MGKAPRRPDPDDERAFAEAVRGARPLDRRTGRVVTAEPSLAAARPPPGRDRADGSSPTAGEPGPQLDIVERWGERYALLATGADRRILRELAQTSPQQSLDL